MEFDNTFEVAVPPEKAWPILMDIERIAPCVPGAKLTEKVNDRSYKGTIGVRLGPVALTFAGQATFEEMDDADRRARVKAQGSDSKGRGGAQAEVSFHMVPCEKGARVVVHTDLQLSGAVAQYGRGVGMVKDVAQAIINQFAANLEKRVIAPGAPAATTPATAPAEQPAPAASQAPKPAPEPEPEAAAPVQIGSLGLKVLWAAFLRGLRRLFGGG